MPAWFLYIGLPQSRVGFPCCEEHGAGHALRAGVDLRYWLPRAARPAPGLVAS